MTDSGEAGAPPGFTSFSPPKRVYFFSATVTDSSMRMFTTRWKHTGNSPESHWIAAATAMRESIFLSTGLAKSRGQDSNNPWAMVPTHCRPWNMARFSRACRPDQSCRQ